MTDCRRLSFSTNRQGLNGSASSSSGVEGCHKERLKENGNFLGGCKQGANLLIDLGWRRNVRSCVGLSWLGATVRF